MGFRVRDFWLIGLAEGFKTALPRFQKISVRDVDATLLVGLGVLGFMRTYEGLYGFMRAYDGLWGSGFKDEGVGLSVFGTLAAPDYQSCSPVCRQADEQTDGQTDRQAGRFSNLGSRVFHPSIHPSIHPSVHPSIDTYILLYIHAYIL